MDVGAVCNRDIKCRGGKPLARIFSGEKRDHKKISLSMRYFMRPIILHH
jgi:hypothetical protein